MREIKIDSIKRLPEVAQLALELGEGSPIWVLNGSMGAGKTTFTKVVCELLAVSDHVTSPTFSIVNEYAAASDRWSVIYHFDFYRMEDEEEALGIGVDEYFYSDNLCIIEWAERIPSYLPESFLEIQINPGMGEERTFKFIQHGKTV